MEDKSKTKEQLINELEEIRKQMARSEAAEAEYRRINEDLRRSGERWRSILDRSPIGIGIATLDGKVISSSKGMEAITGYSFEELRNIGLTSIYENQEDRKYLFKMLERNGSVVDCETRLKRKDGTTYDALLNVARVDIEGEDALETICIDITEKKRAQDDIRQIGTFNRRILENAPYPILIQNPDTSIIYVNPELEKLTGYNSAELVNQKAPYPYWPAEMAQQYLQFMKGRFGMPLVSRVPEIILRKRNGESFIVEVSAASMMNSQNETEYIVSAWVDITERKRMENRLRETEQNLRNSLNESPLGIRIITEDGDLLYANKAILDIYGYGSVEELETIPTRERYTPESYAEHQKRKELRQRGKPVPSNYEISIICKDGEIRHIAVSHNEVIWNGKTQFQIIYQDITERKKTEDAIKLQAKLLDLQSDLVYVTDFDKRNIIYANDAACAATGYTKEELLNMKMSELNDPEAERLVVARKKKILESGQIIFEKFQRCKNGSLMSLEAHISLLEIGDKKMVMSVDRDITEHKKMQEQMMAQDRLASIGQLVAGVAHEINNPLTSILGFSELLLQRELPDDIRADVKIVNDEAHRTDLIVKGLLSFVRKQPEGKTLVQINDNIQTVLNLRTHEQKVNNIQVSTNLANNLPEIMGNASQLQQVFFNLIINAEQAMLEAHNKGTLTITTESMGNTVKTRITDDGPGISPENMKKLFTPFFTTKEVGKGTGLGLSICQGIIAEHGGRIYAESEVGQGATFIVDLPIKQRN